MNVKFPFSESSISTPEINAVTEHMKSLQPYENMQLDSSVDQLLAALKEQQLMYIDFKDEKSSMDCMEDFFVLDSNTTCNPLQQKCLMSKTMRLL